MTQKEVIRCSECDGKGYLGEKIIWYHCPYCSFDCTDDKVMQDHVKTHEKELVVE